MNPDWSPDGTTIAFDRVRLPKDPQADLHPHLWLENADGSGSRRLFPGPSDGLCDCSGLLGHAAETWPGEAECIDFAVAV